MNYNATIQTKKYQKKEDFFGENTGGELRGRGVELARACTTHMGRGEKDYFGMERRIAAN